MRWLQSKSQSSTPSSSSSSPISADSSRNKNDNINNPSNLKNSRHNNNSSNNNNNNNNNNNDKKDLRGPRFSRQKKPWSLRDQGIAGVAKIAHADMGEWGSPGDNDHSSRKSTSMYGPVPLPLPLPLPVPEGSGGRGVEERERDGFRYRVDSPGEEVSSSNSPITRRVGRNKPEYSDMRSPRTVYQDLYVVERSGENIGISLPNKSDPTSPCTSPVLSPQRRSAGQMFQYKVPKENQHGWSTPEMPALDIPGLPPPVFIDYTAFSTENSPFHSPRSRSPCRNIISPSGPSSPIHSKLSCESTGLSPFHSPRSRSPCRNTISPSAPSSPIHSKLSRESTGLSPFHSPRSRSPCPNTISPSAPSSPIHSKLSHESTGLLEVHPLPLPPGAGMLSPSAPILQIPAKPESLPMNSQWQKGKLIGRGTFGSVYAASNRETGALCAMKEVEMFPDDPKSADCIKQLEQEIKVLSQLKHPNIVQYYGSEIVKDRFYIYLEYVHPGSINKYIHEHCGAITESVVRNFTRHILCGLAYLHSKKTIHRDIKGANLLVDASGVVKLADFGMAKHLTGQIADLSLKGSPYWMAPELMMAVMQKDNNSDLALAVDIWSLGCTIIEMLTGKPPWSEYEGAAAMFKVMRDSPAIPKSLSADGKDFLRCCFQRNPAGRPSASMLLEHRFLKNSQQPDVPSHFRSFSGTKSTEKPHSPRESSDGKFDQVSERPSSQSTNKANPESENGQQLRHETSNLTVTSLCSPRSALEVPSLSPPHSGDSTHHSNASTIVLEPYWW